MSIRYSSLYARNVTRGILAGVEVESTTFIYNGPKPEVGGGAVIINGTYTPATNGIATFNASAALTDHIVFCDIPFGARITRAQFQQGADPGNATTSNVGFGLITPAGVVNVAGNNPTIETVFTNSLTTGGIVSAAAGFLDGTTGVEANALTYLMNLLPAVRPAGRTADSYQLIGSPLAGAVNASFVRFNIELIYP